MRKVMASLLGASLIGASALAITTTAAPAMADDPCTGDWVIGMGGFTVNGPGIFGEDSTYIASNQPVGYNSADPNSGLAELNRLFWQHRSDCPADHIKIVAHSEGAGIAHAWVSANQGVDNASAVLIADPKYQGPPGGPGLSASGGFLGYPLAGTDADFGNFPVLTVCNQDDVICNSPAGWYGYFTGAHGRYDFNGFDYPDDVSGVWFNG